MKNTHQTIPTLPVTDEVSKRLHDPILEELWAVKAQINAEAGYDLATILARAKAFSDPYFDASGRVRLVRASQ